VGTTPDAWIYDEESIGFEDPANPSILDLSGRVHGERRLWRLPPGKISPILSSLFLHVSHLAHSESEEIKLVIELRNLLVLRSNGRLGLLGKGTPGIPKDKSRKLRGHHKEREHRGRGELLNTRGQSYGKEGAELIDRQRKARESPWGFEICNLF
jgi:hypothetical protein